MPLQPLDLSWLGGGVGGLLRSGRATNEGGSAYGGQRTLGKDFLEGVGTATDERFASEAKKARSLRTYLGELDPSLKDKVQAMGLGDLEGHAMKLADDRRKAQENEAGMARYLQMLNTADEMNARRQQQAQQSAGTAALGRYLGALAQPEPPEMLQAPGYSRQGAALQAAGADLAMAPAGNLRALSDFMPGAMGGNKLEFQEDPESGVRFAKYGNTLLNSGVNPNRMGSVQTFTDENGNAVRGYLNYKGNLTQFSNHGATLTAAQAAELYSQTAKTAAQQRYLKQAASDPKNEQASLWGPDQEAALGKLEADLAWLDVMRKRGAAAPAANAPAVRTWDPVNKRWLQ